MIKQQFTILNKLGLHARAAAKLVECASRFSCEIWLVRDQKKANAKSILNVMMLGANQGSQIEISVNGIDENAALAALATLIEKKFNEE